MWILSALRDNGVGHLHSFDLIDNALRNVPPDLADGRWSFVQGDVKRTVERVPTDTGYLFLDASHRATFARRYLQHLFPRIAAGTPTSVHDVFHFRATLTFHEGKVVMRWLDGVGTPVFTPSRAKARDTYNTLNVLRAELGLTPVLGAGDNPMIYFRMPSPPGRDRVTPTGWKA